MGHKTIDVVVTDDQFSNHQLPHTDFKIPLHSKGCDVFNEYVGMLCK